MSIGRIGMISGISSALLVAAARATLEFDFVPGAVVLSPGGLADILRTRSVHGGWRGVSSEITVEGISFLAWFLVLFAIIALLDFAIGCVRKNKNA